MKFFGLTDVGRKRLENEDSFIVSDEHQFGILADGMGGRDHGEVASAMAVDLLSDRLMNELPRQIRRLERTEQVAMTVNLLDEWIRHVNLAIFRKSQTEDGYQEMGTTLVCLVVLDRSLILAHVGDSRCYLFKDGALTQLTEDHSLVNSQVKSGMFTEEEARESSQRNIITRAVGTAEKVKADIIVHDLVEGARYLVCSDGLHDMLTDEKMAIALGRNGSLEEIGRVLVDAANSAGGKDNITVLLGQSDS